MIFSRGFEYKVPRDVLIVNVLSAIAYIILFRVIYTLYLVPLFGYLGYKEYVATDYEETLTNILAFLPILFFRARKVPSDLIAILCYIVIHIPTIITLQCNFKEYDGVILFQVMFTLAHIMFFLVSWNEYGDRRFETYTRAVPMVYYVVAGTVVLLGLVAFFGDQLRFVSFADIYSLRNENDKFARGYVLVSYFSMWAAYFFAPLFIAYGCHKKRVVFVALGLMCSLVVYMASGSKSAILLPLAVFAIYFFMSRKWVGSLKYMFPAITLVVLLLFLAILFVDSKLVYMIGTVLFMRTLGVAGWLACGYITVFKSYPFTYFSHIGIVNYFTGMYPFHNPSLGNAVWAIYRGQGVHTNANANFLLTDGFAALGIPGIFVMACLFYCLLVYINRLANNHEMPFVMATLTGTVVAVTNVSLFTTLLSGGLFFCLLLLRFTSPTDNKPASL